MSDTPSQAAENRPNHIGSGRKGAIRKKLDEALAEARKSDRMTTEHELTGAMAGKVASLVDDYARRGDGAGMLRAVNTLRDLVDTLPIREVRGEVPTGDGASGGATLHAIIDSPPVVGDTADA